MSFSKAPLRRFNEEIPQVPSPGRYDPKLDSSVKGAVMPTSKRFPGQATTSSSLDNLDKTSSASSNIVFRTPQVLRKVPLTPRLQYLKDKNFDTSGSDILSSDEKSCFMKSGLKKTVSKADYKRLENEFNSLTDKFHKMLYEKELEVNALKEELDEIKVSETKLKEIVEEKIKLVSDRHSEALQLKENLDTMVEKLNVDREEHNKYISQLKLEISELQNKKYELETVLAEKQSVIVTINDKYSDLEDELKSLQEENLTLEQANSCILMGAEEKLQELESYITSKLQTFEENLDTRYQEEQKPSQSRMNYFVHEFNLKSKEKIEQVKQSQEKVKELQRLVDKKVKEFSEEIKEADERCKCLFRELCKVEEQRDELVVSDLEKKLALIDIQEKSDHYHSELEECRTTCRKYQITVNTMNSTITALSNRLVESEEEVERLNGVEKDLELQKQVLEEKSQLLLADIQALRESMDKMEEHIIQDVSALKEDLEAKVDLFKEKAMETEQLLNQRIYEKQCAIDILLKENDYFKKEVERKSECIEEIQNREKTYEKNIIKLKAEHSKLEEELSEKLSAQKNLHTILNNKLENAVTLISELQQLKAQHEDQIRILITQVEELKESCLSFKNENSEQHSKINSLQLDIEKNKEVEIKQKQYIDELISDLVLEKERCVSVESEKDRLKGLLHEAELNVKEKEEEKGKLLCHIESLQKIIKNQKEEISLIESEKVTFKKKLANAENQLEELKLSDSDCQTELKNQITDLKCQLSSVKEKIKTEIPKLERDNINKAENILQLNINVDTLKEEIETNKTTISCLEAEKLSLQNVLEEVQLKVCDLERAVHGKNLTISTLNGELSTKDAVCKSLISQLESLSSDYNKQNKVLKEISENNMKVSEVEEKVFQLELQLLQKDEELDLLKKRMETLQLDQVELLKEQLEELKIKYDTAVEAREKLSREVGELLGHQNVHQKIKKVSELKQDNVELRDENNLLRLENMRLKAKIESLKKQSENNKENVSIVQREEKHKSVKPGSAKKKPMSPSVLKPSNF